MKQKNYLYAMVMMAFFIFGCDPREDIKQPVACFEFYPSTEIMVGEVITFTNCSSDAETYEWSFGDGTAGSVAENPTHTFAEAKTYTVSLIVQNKNKKDQIEKQITVTSSVTACFTISPNPAKVNEYVYFTNCSTGADSYEWDADGNNTIDSYDANPIFYYPSEGVYTIKLTAIKGTAKDVVSTQLTVNNETVTIDPRDYNGIPGWETQYYNDFSTATEDWVQGTGETWSAVIYGGYYTIKDTDASAANYGRYYTTTATYLPNDYYDFEVRIRNTDDNMHYGSGVLYGLNASTGNLNYYKFSTGYYVIGDSDGVWQDWTSTSYGVSEDWNKLTVRKYGAKYYYFINQQYIYEDDYSAFGTQLGFLIDQDTHVDIDAVAVYLMKLTTSKTVRVKQTTNTNINTGKGESFDLLYKLPKK